VPADHFFRNGGVGQARVAEDALGEGVSVRADRGVDALEGECESVTQIFAAQREGGGQHLDEDGDEEARGEQDNDEGDEGIEALEHKVFLGLIRDRSELEKRSSGLDEAD